MSFVMQARNCLPCKKRKIKCDRRVPCGPCRMRSVEADCVATDEQISSSTFVALHDQAQLVDTAHLKSQIDALQRQVSLLQRAVLRLDSTIAYSDLVDSSTLSSSLSAPHALSSISTNTKSIIPSSTAQPSFSTATVFGHFSQPQAHAALSKESSGSNSRDSNGNNDRVEDDDVGVVSARVHPSEDEVAYVLEDFQMSHRLNRERTLATPMPTFDQLPLQPILGNVSHPWSFLLSPGTDYIIKALECLPDQGKCHFLVNTYFQKVEWFQRTLHQPSFLRRCHSFWRLEGISPDTQIDPDFLCCYVMVICLGLHTLSANSCDELGWTVPEARAIANNLFHVAQAVLWFSRVLSRQTFESLQAISLISTYGYDADDGADAMWSLSGMAIKIAQNLGMSRLGAEDSSRKWPSFWSTRLRREMGRRVWWTFVGLDWSHAIAHSSTYSVHPSQNHTILPGNFDDVDLENTNPVERPLSERTTASMSIFKFRFTILYREITDYMSTHKSPSYSFVQTMDAKINRLIDSMPSHFKDPQSLLRETTETHMLESIFLRILTYIRLIRLHRPYLLRGYRESAYAQSTERCVAAAMSVLELVELANSRAPVLFRFWMVQFYMFTAAVVAFIDSTRHADHRANRMLAKVLEIFKSTESFSPAARNSVVVLEGLFASQEALASLHPGAIGKKRKLDEAVSPVGSETFEAHLSQIVEDLMQSNTATRSTPQNEPPVVLPTTNFGTNLTGFTNSHSGVGGVDMNNTDGSLGVGFSNLLAPFARYNDDMFGASGGVLDEFDAMWN